MLISSFKDNGRAPILVILTIFILHTDLDTINNASNPFFRSYTTRNGDGNGAVLGAQFITLERDLL